MKTGVCVWSGREPQLGGSPLQIPPHSRCGAENIQHKFIVKTHNSWAQCQEVLMPVLERLAQKDHNFEARLGYADSSRLA